jgi:hypothetical protein
MNGTLFFLLTTLLGFETITGLLKEKKRPETSGGGRIQLPKKIKKIFILKML